ncbi:MAG: hypothetical protein H0T66_00330 [Geodermatophilaceae bacterium]|nr:hypothetical protein [Geodermatophilaceae bacterium]MDQ3456543.1 hypothetical protein [Actinomycetota bacterium]
MLADTEPVPKAGPHEWVGLAMLALPALLVALDLTVHHLAVPSVSSPPGGCG